MQKQAGKRRPTVSNCRQKPIVIKAGNVPVKIYRGKPRVYETRSGKIRRHELFTLVYYSRGARCREAFGNEERARERANEIARAIINDRLALLELTNTDRESYLRAVNLLRPLGVPLHSAIEEYVAARSILNGAALLPALQEHAAARRNIVEKRVLEVVDEMIASKERGDLSKRYVETLRTYLNRFASAFQTNIENVFSRAIGDWLASLKLGPRGHNNIRQAVVTLFKFAQRRGYLPKGCPTEAEDVEKMKDRGGKIGVFVPAELASLMENASQEIELYLALGAFSGMRSAEILRLAWCDVNFERGHIIVAAEKAKTATRRLVPIQPNLMQWLAPYRARSGAIFRTPRIVGRVTRFAKTKGIDWPMNVLRHSYATYRLAAIADTARVALEMGNSPQKLMTNYRELADEREAAQWFSISPEQPKNVVGL
jgi:integrase